MLDNLLDHYENLHGWKKKCFNTPSFTRETGTNEKIKESAGTKKEKENNQKRPTEN